MDTVINGASPIVINIVNSTHLESRRKEVIEGLPTLDEEDLVQLNEKNSSCPICFTPFLAILASEELASVMDSSAVASSDLGVTRLSNTCGHIFCRKDISAWLRQNNSCPTCRRPIISSGGAGVDSDQNGDPYMAYELLNDIQVPEGLQSPEFFGTLLRALRETAALNDHENDRNRILRQERNEHDEFFGLYS